MMPPASPDLSIILPCHAATPVALRTVEVLSNWLPERFPSWEILVVDDGGNDFAATPLPDVPGIRLLAHPRNLGKGAAVRTGMLTARGRVRVFTDIDMPYDRELVQQLKTGYGNIYVTVNNDEQGEPFEVFATIGKSGGFFQEQSEGICRLVSLALRSGVKIEDVIDNLKGIRGPMPVITNRGTVLSLPDAIGRILDEHVRGGTEFTPAESDEAPILEPAKETVQVASSGKPARGLADFGMMPECPDCGANLILAEGCMSCKSCGFSRCM